MRKSFFIVLFLCLCSVLTSIAQTRKSFEIEPFLSMDYPVLNVAGTETIHPGLGIEGRYNFSSLPIDVGAELSLSVAQRNAAIPFGERFLDVTLRNASAVIFGDYTFATEKKLSPFLGIGIGIAQMHEMGATSDWTTPNQGVTVVPRFGIELFHHLRVTLDCRILNKYYNTIGLKVGYAFGGGMK